MNILSKFLLACRIGDSAVFKKLLSTKEVKESLRSGNISALTIAAIRGHEALVNELLKIQEQQLKVSKNFMRILVSVVTHGFLNVLERFLRIEAIANNISINNNLILHRAIVHNKVLIIDRLFALPQIFKNDLLDHKKIFFDAVKQKNFHLIELLLKFDKIAFDNFVYDPVMMNYLKINSYIIYNYLDIFFSDTLEVNLFITIKLFSKSKFFKYANSYNNALLKWSIINEITELALILLKIPVVRNTAQHNDEILAIACRKNLTPVIIEILKIDNMVKNLNEKTFSQLGTLHNIPIINTLLYLSARPIIEDNISCLKTLKRRIQENIQKTIPAFLSPQGEAGRIIYLNKQYKKLIFTETTGMDAEGQDYESSMDQNLLEKAQNDFTNIIVPTYEVQFNSYGNSVENCLTNIEKLIREAILNDIEEVALRDKNSKIIKFIKDNRLQLIENHPTSILKSINYFDSNAINGHIAWRCYNPFINEKNKVSFFIKPNDKLKSNIVFTTSYTSSKSLTLEEAVQITRTRAAYYFLHAYSKEDESLRLLKIKNFINYLAEIRRAHNNDQTRFDDPSCFPGTLGRLALNFCENQSLTKKEILRIFLTKYVLNKIADTFETLSYDGALFFSDALTGLGFRNAVDIILNNGKTNAGYFLEDDCYTQQHLILRSQFINRLIDYDFDRFLLDLEKILQKDHKIFCLTPADRAYVEFFIYSLAEDEILNGIGHLFNRKHQQLTTIVNNEETINPFQRELNCTVNILKNNTYPTAMIEKLTEKLKNLEEQKLLFDKIIEKDPKLNLLILEEIIRLIMSKDEKNDWLTIIDYTFAMLNQKNMSNLTFFIEPKNIDNVKFKENFYKCCAINKTFLINNRKLIDEIIDVTFAKEFTIEAWQIIKRHTKNTTDMLKITL